MRHAFEELPVSDYVSASSVVIRVAVFGMLLSRVLLGDFIPRKFRCQFLSFLWMSKNARLLSPRSGKNYSQLHLEEHSSRKFEYDKPWRFHRTEHNSKSIHRIPQTNILLPKTWKLIWTEEEGKTPVKSDVHTNSFMLILSLSLRNYWQGFCQYLLRFLYTEEAHLTSPCQGVNGVMLKVNRNPLCWKIFKHLGGTRLLGIRGKK